MKHKAFTVVEAIVVVVILAILAAMLFPYFARPKPRDYCMSNLKQIGLGFQQYIQDYDEKFPPLTDWGETVQPYLKSWQIFQCPMDASGSAEKTTDYFLNARLSGVAIRQIAKPSLTILAGDGASDQRIATLAQLPASWIDDKNSPAHRHPRGANYAFADGRVKRLHAQSVTLDKPKAGKPTFLLGGSKP